VLREDLSANVCSMKTNIQTFCSMFALIKEKSDLNIVSNLQFFFFLQSTVFFHLAQDVVIKSQSRCNRHQFCNKVEI
jgi:hypothetical protein